MAEMYIFPLMKDDQSLTIEQASLLFQRTGALKGLLLGFKGEEITPIISFGGLSRMEALWLSERLRMFALGVIEEDDEEEPDGAA